MFQSIRFGTERLQEVVQEELHVAIAFPTGAGAYTTASACALTTNTSSITSITGHRRLVR